MADSIKDFTYVFISVFISQSLGGKQIITVEITGK